MRIGSLASARPAYYDRNPTRVAYGTSSLITANESVIQLSVYTVPAGKKCLLSHFELTATVVTALAAGNNNRNMRWEVLDSTGTNYQTIAEQDFYKTAVGDFMTTVVPCTATIVAGEQILLTYQATVSAGSMRIYVIFMGTQYDA